MSSRGILVLASVFQRAVFFLGACALLTGVLKAEAGKYLGPIDVVAAPDQKTLYVVEMDGQRVDVLDAASNQIVRNIACPAAPTGLAVSADGSKLYVTCGGPQGIVCVAEASTGNVLSTIPVGHSPCCAGTAARRKTPDRLQSVHQ